MNTMEIFSRTDPAGRILLLCVVIMNLIGFCMMGIDKKKAVRHKWRIPEKAFFIVSILSGSIGTLAGMYVFRHKTKHGKFVIGIPVILILQVILAVYLNMRL